MKNTSPQILLTTYFQMFINACVSGRRLTVSGKKITTGTIRSYQYTMLLLLEFEKKKAAPLRIQLLHRASMPTIQKEKNYWARFFVQFTAFLYKDKDYYDNYVGNIFKVIKHFLITWKLTRALVSANFIHLLKCQHKPPYQWYCNRNN